MEHRTDPWWETMLYVLPPLLITLILLSSPNSTFCHLKPFPHQFPPKPYSFHPMSDPFSPVISSTRPREIKSGYGARKEGICGEKVLSNA